MIKNLWLILISLVIGVLVSVNATYFGVFLVGVLLFSSLVFAFGRSVQRTIKYWREDDRKYLSSGVLAVVFLLLLGVALGSVLMANSVCSAVSVPDHFRTNILTGSCDYGGQSAYTCRLSDPWYYSAGCSVSDAEKLKILEREGGYEDILGVCRSSCLELGPELYCDVPDICSGRGITCESILDCDVFYAETMEKIDSSRAS